VSVVECLAVVTDASPGKTRVLCESEFSPTRLSVVEFAGLPISFWTKVYIFVLSNSHLHSGEIPSDHTVKFLARAKQLGISHPSSVTYTK